MRINYRVVRLVPIPNKNGVIPGRVRERNWNTRPAKDPDPSKSTSSLVECQRWEVVEAPNLIFHLKYVSEVLPWWYRARCAVHTVLERVPPLLNPIPIIFHHSSQTCLQISANKNISAPLFSLTENE